MNYYVSDTHFGHYNIIKHSKRPFETVEEMDEAIIKNWNNKVTNSDIVYILGDLVYRSSKSVAHYVNSLNGELHIIPGNHDKFLIKAIKEHIIEGVILHNDIFEIEDNNRRIIMCHYPMVEWNGFFRDSIHLYGHIHNNTGNDTYNIIKNIKNAYNVGVDIIGFAPATLDEVIKANIEFNISH